MEYELHSLTASDPNYKKLIQSLKQWLILYSPSMIITDIYKDLFVAPMIVTMLRELTGETIIDLDSFKGCTAKDFKLIMGVLTQFILKTVLKKETTDRWSLKGIISGDYSSLVAMLVDLAYEFECPYLIPANVTMAVMCTQVINGAKTTKTSRIQVTDARTLTSPTTSKENISTPAKLMTKGLQGRSGSRELLSPNAKELISPATRRSSKDLLGKKSPSNEILTPNSVTSSMEFPSPSRQTTTTIKKKRDMKKSTIRNKSRELLAGSTNDKLNDKLDASGAKEQKLADDVDNEMLSPPGVSYDMSVQDLYEELIDSPEKFEEISQLLCDFTNKNLEEVGLNIQRLSDLSNGANLLILIGIIGRFFIPFDKYHLNPKDEKQRIFNVELAIQLMEELGIDVSPLDIIDIERGDLKTISRAVFYIQQLVSG
ncbi:hypothetical protein BC833DRAFT_577778 [Globomyces pollinis-pini]|nr:hypothetical protein BC833DRAFT_577778 [Globomyces pollinis-pini]